MLHAGRYLINNYTLIKNTHNKLPTYFRLQISLKLNIIFIYLITEN